MIIITHSVYILNKLEDYDIPEVNSIPQIPFTDPDIESIVDPDDIHFLNLKLPICSSSTRLLILVFSKPSDFYRRNVIRNTWGNTTTYNTRKIKVLFLIGFEGKNYGNLMTKLRNEERAFGDILLTKLRERYYNMAIKTWIGMNFATKCCEKVDCTMKSDSDNILNLENLYGLCMENRRKRSIIGYCSIKTSVDRSPLSKWRVPYHVIPQEHYPQYCSGAFYMITSRGTLDLLLQNLNKTTFFDSTNFRYLPEDLIFTGFLADEAKIPRKSNSGFNIDVIPTIECKNGRSKTYGIHVGHHAHNQEHFMCHVDMFHKFNKQPC